MKRKIVLLLSMMIILSGCSLFPLKEDTKPSVGASNSGEDTKGTTGQGESGNLVKPAEVDENDEVVDTSTEVMYCIAAANIRDSASSNSSVVGALRTGDQVNVLSRDGAWIEIVHEGQSGFVYERFLGDEAP